jgi:hypothetical protein
LLSYPGLSYYKKGKWSTNLRYFIQLFITPGKVFFEPFVLSFLTVLRSSSRACDHLRILGNEERIKLGKEVFGVYAKGAWSLPGLSSKLMDLFGG